MKLTFTFKQMESDSSLKNYAKEKSEKIKKYIRHPIDLHYFFSESHGKTHTEMTLLADHHKFVAEASDSKGLASVDAATDKLVAQLRKSKEKGRDHHKTEKPRDYGDGE